MRLELEPGDPLSQVAVASAEDTIVSKLRWYRLTGEVSDRQWNDVAGIVTARRGRLDLAYLRHWAERLGVAELLERLLSS
ncbi:MAG: hypothetical protein IT380_01120 [Myxococcales bacterium]|nr:hypothetical protein [Myxococcales bacterium]